MRLLHPGLRQGSQFLQVVVTLFPHTVLDASILGKRMVKNVTYFNTRETIDDYRTTLRQLSDNFQKMATVDTQVRVYGILDNIEDISRKLDEYGGCHRACVREQSCMQI